MNIIFRRKGKSLYLYVRHRSKELWIRTEVRIDPDQWDDKRGYFKEECEKKCEKIYGKILDRKVTDLQSAIYDLEVLEKPVTSENIRRILFNEKSVERKSIQELVDDFLIFKSATVKNNTLRKLGQIKDKLVRFQAYTREPLDPATFNVQDFSRFVRFLSTQDKLSDNTISTQCGVLREFLKFLNPSGQYGFIDYKEKYFNVVYLTAEEVQVLEEAKDLPPYLDNVRNLFLLGCYSGVRYCDLKEVNLDNLDDGVIEVFQSKTQKVCYVAYSDEIAEIIDRKPRVISNQNLNDYLKVLFKDLGLDRPITKSMRYAGVVTKTTKPLHEVIASHVARKTFVMGTLTAGFNVIDVIDMSGHSDFKALKPYRTGNKSRIRDISKEVGKIYKRNK